MAQYALLPENVPDSTLPMLLTNGRTIAGTGSNRVLVCRKPSNGTNAVSQEKIGRDVICRGVSQLDAVMEFLREARLGD
jgi:hypothetical protein